MEKILDFAKNNYILFLIISVILIFALIGYIVEAQTGKDIKIRTPKNKKNKKQKTDDIETI